VAAEIRFEAMGTRANIVLVGGPDGLASDLRRRVLDLESRWSRFVETSEISRLNRAGGAPVHVSDDTLELLAHAVAGWEATYGLFDPTILGDLERAGYDRSFEQLTASDELVSGTHRRSWLVRGCEGLELDAHARTARLRAGVGFDPGGIGKGFAADLVAREAIDQGAEGVLIELGGDVRVIGVPPERTGCWRIGVEHPLSGTTIASVQLADGAVATSSRTRRRWVTADGVRRHHLIDPLLAAPADTDVLSATAVAAEGWQAEVLAKAAFIGGPVQGVGLVDLLGGAALVVAASGEPVTGPAWTNFARAA
jgi:FAD:protein FMN transferase